VWRSSQNPHLGAERHSAPCHKTGKPRRSRTAFSKQPALGTTGRPQLQVNPRLPRISKKKRVPEKAPLNLCIELYASEKIIVKGKIANKAICFRCCAFPVRDEKGLHRKGICISWPAETLSKRRPC
jgi:hypothetical protein